MSRPVPPADTDPSPPTGAAPPVSTLTVNYNGGQAAVQDLERSRRTADPLGAWQWIVVDNASSDGSREAFARLPDLELVARPRNDGFAAGVNAGLERARGTAILLLNPDAHLDAGGATRLLATLAEDERLAAVGPQLVFPDGRVQESAYRFATPLARLFRLLGGKALLRALGLLRGGRIHLAPGITTVEVVKGACMLTRRTAWDDIGPLDEEFFLYHEEMDWCRRANARGWRCAVDARARVAHAGAYQGDPREGERFVHSTQGLQHYFEKHYGAAMAGLLRGALRANLALRRVANRLAPGRSPELRRRLAATLRAAARRRPPLRG